MSTVQFGRFRTSLDSRTILDARPIWHILYYNIYLFLIISFEQVTPFASSKRIDDKEYVRRFSLEMAFKLLTSGRPELITQALGLLPASKINTINDSGLTALMLACINGDESAVLALVDAGADLNVETPAPSYSNQSTTTTTPSRHVTCQSPSVLASPAKNGNLSASSSSLSGSPSQNNNYHTQTSPSLVFIFYSLL